VTIKISDLNTKVDTQAYGTLEFFGLRDKDKTWLLEAQTKALPAREFTVYLIQSHLITPTLDLETITGWPDDFLLLIANEWLKKQQHDKASMAASSFEELKQGVYIYKDELVKVSSELFDAFTTNLKSIMQPILPDISTISISSTHLSDLASGYIERTSAVSQFATAWESQIAGVMTSVESVTKDLFASTALINDAIAGLGVDKLGFAVSELATQSIFENLPDFTDWEEISKEIQASDQAFRASGYSFINHLISYESVRHFASINIKVRNAAITNSMAATTRRKEFEEQLHQLFQQSSVLRLRWKIVEKALCAHRQRDYDMSVLPLLAQVEGILGDALILKKLVHREGNALYLKENGVIKVGKKGDRVKAHGLDTLINHSKWRDHDTLQGVAELITSRLAEERNGIMHGRKVDYGTAKLSAQCLLLLLVLAAMFVDIENGRA